jgi:hypothetical protein
MTEPFPAAVSHTQHENRRYPPRMNWLGLASLSAVIAAGALSAGCGGPSQADHANQARLTAAGRNVAACQYVLVTWSGLAQRYPRGYRASEFDHVVADASSPALRHELSLLQAAVATKNLPEVPQAGGEMVKTCSQLGLSEVDR